VVGPKDTGKFFYPPALGLVQPGSESLEDGLVGHLGLSISLRVSHRGEAMMDIKAGTELLKLSIVELSSIIDDDGVGEYEVADDQLLEELTDLGFSDPC